MKVVLPRIAGSLMRRWIITVFICLLQIFLVAQRPNDKDSKLANGDILVEGGPFTYLTATDPAAGMVAINLSDLDLIIKKPENFGIAGNINPGGSITVRAFAYLPGEQNLHKYLLYGGTLNAEGQHTNYAMQDWKYPVADGKSVGSRDILGLITYYSNSTAPANATAFRLPDEGETYAYLSGGRGQTAGPYVEEIAAPSLGEENLLIFSPSLLGNTYRNWIANPTDRAFRSAGKWFRSTRLYRAFRSPGIRIPSSLSSSEIAETNFGEISETEYDALLSESSASGGGNGSILSEPALLELGGGGAGAGGGAAGGAGAFKGAAIGAVTVAGGVVTYLTIKGIIDLHKKGKLKEDDIMAVLNKKIADDPANAEYYKALKSKIKDLIDHYLIKINLEVSVKNASFNSVKIPGLGIVYAKDFKRSADDTLFYKGADLSSVNEIEDYFISKNGGNTVSPYKVNGIPSDCYQIFRDKGANLIRIRLWHNPAWTRYSNLSDVTKALRRARESGFKTLLDFHYSDSWADPGKQVVPEAWRSVVNNTGQLSDSVYNYTKNTLMNLYQQGLLPDMVQLGNEINNNILVASKDQTDVPGTETNFARNVILLNKAMQAVTEVSAATGSNIKKILHIGGGPHLADWWLSHHIAAGLKKELVDIFGFSYYFFNRDPEAPSKSVLDINDISVLTAAISTQYNLNVMMMETGVPWTLAANDASANMYGRNNLLNTYGTPGPETVRDFMYDLSYMLKHKGKASGIVYWEPAWIAAPTKLAPESDAQPGSPYENCALFDFNNNANAGMDFYSQDLSQPRMAKINVRFKVTIPDAGSNSVGSAGISLVVFSEHDKMEIFPMTADAGTPNSFVYTCPLFPKTTGGFAFIKGEGPNFRNNFPWNIEPLYWGIYSRFYPVTDQVSGITKYPPVREYVLGNTDQQINCQWGRVSLHPNNLIASLKKNYNETISHVVEEGANFVGKGNALKGKVGDVVSTEWRADYFPYAEDARDSINAKLKIEGIPAVWIANEGGESRYYCTPSVKPGELNPWLGFDSQVHGTALRNFDSTGTWKFKQHADSWSMDFVKSYDTIYNYNEFGQVKFYINWPMAREMDSLKSNDVPSYNWEKTQSSGTNSISLPDGGSATTQRNNQREGLNMELLHAWSADWNNINTTHGFSNYRQGNNSRPKYVLGTDPDELIYMNAQTSDANHYPPTDSILRTKYEYWKLVPNKGETDAVNDMVTAYRKNRASVLNPVVKSETVYRGYEIQDNGVSANLPDGNGSIEGNNRAPGADIWLGLSMDGNIITKQHFKLHIVNRLSSGNAPLQGFYGKIQGTQWPAIWEKNLPYTLTGLIGWSDDELKKVSLELQYEDPRGVIRQQTKYLKDAPSATLAQVKAAGQWTSNEFQMQGWGYYNITAYYQYDAHTDRVPLTGKELLEVGLRFVANEKLPLNEGRGDGAYIYLDDFRSRNIDPFTLDNEDLQFGNIETRFKKYGRWVGKYVRSYTFKKGEMSNFSSYDSDPHTFLIPGKEFYLSPRTRAKRIPDDTLNSANSKYLKYFLRKINMDGTLGAETEEPSNGKVFTKTWNEPGIYELRVSYRNISDVYHLIRVKDTYNTVTFNENSTEKSDKVKGEIMVQPLTSELINMFGLPKPSEGNKWYEAHVLNVWSTYKYLTGPRATAAGNPDYQLKDRFGEFNDFADEYYWKHGTASFLFKSGYNYDTEMKNPQEVIDWLTHYDSNIKNKWFPHYWARHYSQAGFPPDFNSSAQQLVKNIGTDGVDEKLDRMISKAYSNRPESWQARLPWISATTFSGYRIRTNIKPVYIMDSLFSNTTGAFSGNASIPQEQAVFLDIQNDSQKDQEEWYNDIRFGRRVIFQAPATGTYPLMVKNYFMTNDPRFSDAANPISVRADSFIAIYPVPAQVLPAEASRSRASFNKRMETNDILSKNAEPYYLNVYPNPASQVLNISFNRDDVGTTIIQLYDMSGRNYLNKQLNTEKGKFTSRIDISAIPRGLYVVSVTTGTSKKETTILIQ